MNDYIHQISIQGFKSISSLPPLTLNSGLNVLIGANGSGKSNFIESFFLIKKIKTGFLNNYVSQRGGADTFLHNGINETDQIEFKLTFINDGNYHDHTFGLIPTVDKAFIISDQTPYFSKDISFFNTQNQWSSFDHEESILNKTINNWEFYHFQNTSLLSNLRKDASIYNSDKFLPEGSNLSAVLWKIKTEYIDIYLKIRNIIRKIFPYFNDFILEPIENRQLNDKFVRICWNLRGSNYIYRPWQMSDGILRFLALTVALLQPNPPTTFFIDEPESGLHPESVLSLTSLMHEMTYRSQVIIATHSYDFLDTMEPDNIITVNVSDCNSIFARLSIDDYKVWLKRDYKIGDLWWKNIIKAGPDYE
jgi:predicted ATPase